MSDTHLMVTDPLADPAVEPMPDHPERDDYDGHFVTALPTVEPARPKPAPSLDEIMAALRCLTVQVREVPLDDWSTWRVNLSDVATVTVANRQAGRRSLMITNLAAGGGATAYVAARPTLAPGAPNTYPIAPGVTLTIHASGPVYGCTDAAAAVQLACVAEYDTALMEPF